MSTETVDLSDHLANKDELAELIGPPPAHEPSSLEIACGGALTLVQVPCEIVFKDADDVFVVDDLQAWGWTPFGVFAAGHYASDPEAEVTKLFHGDTIHNIEFNVERYREIVEAIREEETDAADGAESDGDDKAVSDEPTDWVNEAEAAA